MRPVAHFTAPRCISYQRRALSVRAAAAAGSLGGLADGGDAAASSSARPETSASGSELAAHVRAALFAAWTFTLAVPLFCAMLLMALPVLLLDKVRCVVADTTNDCARTVNPSTN